MFENYLEDAYFFSTRAATADERCARRYYRASVFYSMGAIEAFINYIADTLEQSGNWPEYELAFLADRRFDMAKNCEFCKLEQPEYHRIEDKLRFLLTRYVGDFDFAHDPSWSGLLEFKRMRDAITHPRQEEDEITAAQYSDSVATGLRCVINVMNRVCLGIFSRPLRQKLLDLIP